MVFDGTEIGRFYCFIECGNANEVEGYLRKKFPVNHVDHPEERNTTPLHEAAYYGHARIVEILLNHGANLDARNKHVLTALHIASARGNTDVVEVLLNYGANINAQTAYKATPLHEAAYHGNARIVEILLKNGANIDAINENEETPLQLAFKKDQMRIIEILTSKGGKMDSKDRNDVTLLHWASRHGQKELVKSLLDIPEIDVNGADVNGWTILHYASANDRQEVIRTLMKHKADTSIRNKKNETAIHTACTNNKWNSVKILMESNVNDTDSQGRTLLHRSSLHYKEDIMRTLIDKGFDIDSPDVNGRTALHYAIQSGQLTAVKLLLEKKADVNFADKEGYTPLYQAAVYGDTYIVDMLLLHGANVDKANKKGWTPLHYAASCGKLDVVKIVTDKMLDVDVVDKEGQTPLHVAVKYGYPAVVKELLMSGAEVISTPSNKSPFEIAEEMGRADIVKVFKDFLADGLPLEIKLLDSQLADGLKGSLRFGFYYSYAGKIMFVGNEGVGKTAITRLLLGKKPKKKRKPTEGIDIHVNRAAIDRETRKLIPKVLKVKDTAYSNLFMRKTDSVKHTYTRPLKKIVEERNLYSHAKPYTTTLDTDTYHDIINPTLDTDASQKITEQTVYTDVKPDITEPTVDTDASKDITEQTVDTNAKLHITEPTVDAGASKHNIEPTVDVDVNQETVERALETDGNQDIIESVSDTDENQDNLCYYFESPEEDDDNEVSVSSMDSPAPYSPMKRAFSFKSLVGQQKKTPKEHRDFSRKMLRLSARKASSKGIHKKKEAPVIILDFAGQEVFYSTHQSFLTHRGVYVIVINGSLELDDVIESDVFIPGRHEKPTTRGYIKFWVNSILCYSKGKSKSFPKIVICCTHKDKIEKKEVEERRKNIYDEIDKMFSDLPANTHLITEHRIFINAIDQKDREIELLKTVLVDTIMSQPTWGEKMPKSWIHLEMEINKKAKHGDKILTMQKLRKLNKSNPAKVLTDEELDLFLRVHHSMGDLIYFPLSDLRGHVIISPSFIIDALKIIVTDKRFVKEKRLDIWKYLQSEGKIRENELLKMFNNHPAFKKYKDYLIKLMCHLDLLTYPPLFDPDTGKTVKSDFLYVPCMLKSGSAEIYLDKSILSNAIGFSFKFNTSILPSAIGFRLIACCLDLWKVAEYQKKILLFSGMVVVVYNKFVRLIVKNKNDRIDIFLSHTTSRYDIKAQIATSIRVCLSDILQRITDSYKVLSTGTSDHTTSSFQVEYTCYNVISPCYCQERMEWTCCHGDRITQDTLNKWFIDRTITDIDCSSECKGLSTDALQHEPSELHLGKLALHFEWDNLQPALLDLGIENNEIKSIEFNYYHQGLDNIKFHCLRKWKMKQPSCTFNELKRALEKDSNAPHILCKAFRDRPFETNLANDILERQPTDKDLHSIASSVITESLLLCVHLGIDANDWIKMYTDRYPIVDITANILEQWRDNHPGKPKLQELAEALCNVGRSIDILLADSA